MTLSKLPGKAHAQTRRTNAKPQPAQVGTEGKRVEERGVEQAQGALADAFDKLEKAERKEAREIGRASCRERV